jgi:hypothetical protein
MDLDELYAELEAAFLARTKARALLERAEARVEKAKTEITTRITRPAPDLSNRDDTTDEVHHPGAVGITRNRHELGSVWGEEEAYRRMMARWAIEPEWASHGYVTSDRLCDLYIEDIREQAAEYSAEFTLEEALKVYKHRASAILSRLYRRYGYLSKEGCGRGEYTLVPDYAMRIASFAPETP